MHDALAMSVAEAAIIAQVSRDSAVTGAREKPAMELAEPDKPQRRRSRACPTFGTRNFPRPHGST